MPTVGLEPTTTRLKCENDIAVSFLVFSARGGIRTHEAEAVELKSTPFDRSGTLAYFVFFYFLIPHSHSHY